MSGKRTNAVTLSNVWTTSLSSMEAVGDWPTIAEMYRQAEVRPLRLQASAALALTYTADLNEAERIIVETRGTPEFRNDLESQYLLAMATAAMRRRQRQWEFAKFNALKAYALSRKLKSREHEAGAVFSVALCLACMGRQFLAMDCYQRIRNMPGVGPYRKGLAAINEAYILWDLGSWAEMQKLLPQIPASYQPRMKLMLDLVQMNPRLPALMMTAEPPSKIQGERRAILIYLLQASYVFGNEFLQNADKTWVTSTALELDRDEKTEFWCRALASAKRNEVVEFQDDGTLDWRTELDRRFLSFLSRAGRLGTAGAREFYLTEIDPFVNALALQIPLAPPFHALESPRTAWAKMLANVTGIERVDGARDSALKACVVSHQLRLYRDHEEFARIDLRRKAISLRILKIIAGTHGREISKRKMHEELTGTRYSPKLHDQRLQKLMKRLEREITDVAGESLWCWPGTNSLRLLRSIDFES